VATNRLAAQPEEHVVQLATRVPVKLLRRLKLHCVTHGQTMQRFVAAALQEKLKPPRRAP
jgi:hypothetical protein